jgi:hypothetical protein
MNAPAAPGALCDPTCRDLMWKTVLELVLSGPLPLGRLVPEVEAAISDCGRHKSLSACLQEMARGEHIRMSCDGKRWTVSLGPAGRSTLLRLREISAQTSAGTGSGQA